MENIFVTGWPIFASLSNDGANKYLVIDLNGTNYHYCGLDSATWEAFKKASSLGQFYNADIKGRFDCRVYPVPEYGR